MISGIQIALKNAIDVVSDNPDKFRSFVVGSVFDHATAYNVLYSFDREKKTRTFSFIFFPLFAEHCKQCKRDFKAVSIDRSAALYVLRKRRFLFVRPTRAVTCAIVFIYVLRVSICMLCLSP